MKPLDYPKMFRVAMMLSLLLTVSEAHSQQAPPKMAEVLILFRNPPGQSEAELVRKHGGNVKRTFQIVPAVAATLPAAAIEQMKRERSVEAVEIDGTMEAHEIANTWGVDRIGCRKLHDGTFAENASPIRGTGIRVAILDSGIDYSHPELILNYAGGYDFINNDADPMDDQGHGTHVAGTVAAFRDLYGVVGAAPEVDLYGVKVLGSNGSGSFSAIISGLDWCVTNGIAVANLSLGSSGDPGLTVKKAFDNADAAGLVIVASAGNSGEGADTVGYPAKYESVIAVASTTNTDQRSSFSSTGPAVELSAPGSNIFSTLMGGGYGYKSGTSMAAPHVSGAAALLLSAGISDSNGNGRRNDDTRTALQSTATDLGVAGRDSYFGYGLINAESAVTVASNPVTPPPPAIIFEAPTNLTGTAAANTVTLAWTDNSNCEETFQIQYGIKTKSTTQWYQWGTTGPNATQFSGTLSSGSYLFRVRASKDGGASVTPWSGQIQLTVGSTSGGGKRGK